MSIHAALVPRVYPLLRDAVEHGTQLGYTRAHKHTDAPDVVQLCDAIADAVMNEICERFQIVQPAEDA